MMFHRWLNFVEHEYAKIFDTLSLLRDLLGDSTSMMTSISFYGLGTYRWEVAMLTCPQLRRPIRRKVLQMQFERKSFFESCFDSVTRHFSYRAHFGSIFEGEFAVEVFLIELLYHNNHHKRYSSDTCLDIYLS